ncbi:MAG TPA: O-antigen ligase family protein [Mycobacteriales bacterium]|nr:O-antigen ligase family protein [Mycobacteriales bacterium]
MTNISRERGDRGISAAVISATVTSAAAPLLLAVFSVGMLAQGGYYPRVRWYLGLLLVGVVLAALTSRPLARADVDLAFAVPVVGLAGWALLDGVLHGTPGYGAGYAVLLAGVLAVVFSSRRLPAASRESVLAGLILLGTAVAGLGWLGVILHRESWAWLGQGLWRASSTLTYPNATAAVLAVLVLLCLALLTERPRSVPLGLAATALLTGLAGTLSRAGLLGFAVGVAVLAATVGLRAVWQVGRAPLLGAVVATAGLVPSIPASTPPQPVLAAVALVVGLALGAALPAVRPCMRLGFTGIVLGGTAVLLVGSTGMHRAVLLLSDTRLTLGSPERVDVFRAALRASASHLVTGTGPGLTDLTWSRPSGGVSVFRYAHNEYLQVLIELGIVGAVLLLAVLLGVFRSLVRARTGAGAVGAGVLAGAAALAVHAGLDFVWHLPAIPLMAAGLVGLARSDEPARLHLSAVPTGRDPS